MKTIFILLLLIFINNLLAAQNLIDNPGFENGATGWTALWSRDNKGNIDIVDKPVYSGSKALHILYDGGQDWSVSITKKINVKPGEIYEISTWVNAASIDENAQMSVELLDSKDNVIEWVYGSCNFSKTNDKYEKFTGKLSIPDNVSKIVPRLIGNKPCNLHVDDISLILFKKGSESKDITIESDTLRLTLSVPSMKLSMVNKLNKESYTTAPIFEYSVSSVDSSVKKNLVINAYHMINDFDVKLTFHLSGNTLTINYDGDTSKILKEKILFPGPISSKADQYVIVPRAAGFIWPVNKTYPFYTYQFFEWKATMPFIGVTNLKSGYMLVSEDPWDTEAEFYKKGNETLINPRLIHNLTKKKLGYGRSFHFVFVNNGYIEMCKWYREYAASKGFVKTFASKALDNPNMNRLKGAVDFWAITYSVTNDYLEKLIKYGLDKAIINLNDWGQAKNLESIIDSINSKGFLSSRYDIYTDVYPPEHPEETGYRREGYPEDVIVKSDGTLQEGWLAYIKGDPFQGYYTCAVTHAPYANKVLPKELASKHYNCKFIDVELASGLKECYSPIHPATRKTDAQARLELLNTVKNKFSLVTGDEEARDFAFPFVDYGEGTMTMYPQVNSGYDWLNPVDTIGDYYGMLNLNSDNRIPLHGLVYHDVHIPTWYTGDGVSKVPKYWDDKDLFNILYASMPLFMPPTFAYWNSNIEKFLTSYHLISSINRNAGFEQMINHKYITSDRKVQQTEFSNGWKITVNFGASPYQFGSVNLAAKGFYATDGKQDEVFRSEENGSTLAAAFTNDRIFINPYGIEQSYKGFKSSGSLFVKKIADTNCHLAIIGNQTAVSFNPSEMPWNVKGIKIFSEKTGNELLLENSGNGWYSLKIPTKETFFSISLELVKVSVDQNINRKSNIILLSLTKESVKINTTFEIGSISIFDMSGKEISTIKGNQSNEQTIYIKNYKSGYYIFKVISVNKLDSMAGKILVD